MPVLDWIGKRLSSIITALFLSPHPLRTRAVRRHPDAGNLLVQGDNLEALKALLPYYAGRSKCLYRSSLQHRQQEAEKNAWFYNDNVNCPKSVSGSARSSARKAKTFPATTNGFA